MKTLILANSPHVPSGYGVISRLLSQSLIKFGHQVAIAANYGISGALVGSNPAIYPSSQTRAGDGYVWAAIEHFKPDVVISIYDAWALEFPLDRRTQHVPWIAWAPVDSEPLDGTSTRKLQNAAGVVAMSKWGQGVLQSAGIEAHYIPLGVQTDVFSPGSQVDARRGMDVGDAFMVGMVGRNNTAPSRKAFPEAMMAFSSFLRQHRNAYLYLHTNITQSEGGLDLMAVARELGILERTLHCDQVQNILGFPDGYMVNLYRSLDVLLECSEAEGFGIPIVEAEACGTPVIASKHSSMTELVSEAGGWLVGGQLLRSVKNSWFVSPDVSDVVRALDASWKSKQSGMMKYRQRAAREFAERYDFEGKIAPMWTDYLKRFG